MHSKLRNGGAKGRASRLSSTNANAMPTTPVTTGGAGGGGGGLGSSGTSSSNGQTNSATAGLPTIAPSPNVLSNIANIAKQQQENKRKLSSDDPGSNSNDGVALGGGAAAAAATVVNPVTGLNVQILPKKCKTTSPCAISPVLLECPEQYCSKKYKHANGLRYHQSHAHGGGSATLMGDDDSRQSDQPTGGRATSPDADQGGADTNRGKSPGRGQASVGAVGSGSIEGAMRSGGPSDKSPSSTEKKTPSNVADSMDSSNSSSMGATAAGDAGALRLGPGEEMDEGTAMDQSPKGNSASSFKHKKGRKSPLPGDGLGVAGMTNSGGDANQLMGTFASGGGGSGGCTQSNRADEVKSPAYSDISDDSTPVAESDSNREFF